MADPKYAGLYGIATDQSDTYETDDLPEAQRYYDNVDNSEALDQFHINAGLSRDAFKGKEVDSTKVDFSDNIAKGYKIGYDIRSYDELELADDKSKENVLQKYNRLKCEFKELIDDVAEINDKAAASDREKKDSKLDVKELRLLESQLLSLKLEDELLSQQLLAVLAHPKGSLVNNLSQQLATLGERPPAKAADKPLPSSDSSSLYKLYFRPGQSKYEQTSQLSELEKRLERLEAAIGTNPETMSLLSAEVQGKSLLEASSTISNKCMLLEPATVDQVEARLGSLLQKLNKIAEKKTATENNAKQQKVCELYNTLKNMESVYLSLPDIRDRLISLGKLHEQALHFERTLSEMESVQSVITSNLKDNISLLKQVEENVTGNFKTVQNNISSIEAKISTQK